MIDRSRLNIRMISQLINQPEKQFGSLDHQINPKSKKRYNTNYAQAYPFQREITEFKAESLTCPS